MFCASLEPIFELRCNSRDETDDYRAQAQTLRSTQRQAFTSPMAQIGFLMTDDETAHVLELMVRHFSTRFVAEKSPTSVLTALNSVADALAPRNRCDF